MKRYFLAFIAVAATLASTAHGQVTYTLGPATPLLDQNFYDGVDLNGAGPSPSGRLSYFSNASKDSTQVAFWMVSGDFAEVAVFVVTIGDTGSWRRITPGLANSPSAPIAWTPDDGYLLVGNLKIDALTGDSAVVDYGGLQLNDASTTNLSSGNWIATLAEDTAGQDQVAVIPILPDGTLDGSREITFVTNFATGVGPFPDWPAISPDGSRLTFADYYGIAPGTADHGDIYAVDNLPAIIAAPKIGGTQISTLAPTGASDPNVYAIRTTEDSTDNFAHVPLYAQDQSLVFFGEDWNNTFEDDDFFPTLALSDFDVMLSASDGSGSDTRFTGAGNQFISSVTPGGVRLLYLQGVGTDFSLYISSLETTTALTGTPVGNPSDNVIQTSGVQTAGDASGTTITIAGGTSVDFPDASPQAIEMFTPIDPVQTPQLPAGVDGIPVVRDFGPDGTTFTPAVTVTISYTDAEIEGMDEGTLRVFRYNPATMAFDTEITAIVSRDPANNRISFSVDHFSTFGLGFKGMGGMPAVRGFVPLGLLVLTLAGVALRTLRRARAEA